jgi:hypothetical protein
VTDGAVLTIPAGTTLYGAPGTGSATSYMIIDTAGNLGYSGGAQIVANGTMADPVIFTSKAAIQGLTEAPGQWGGLTIVGNAADVGVPPGSEQVGCYEVNEDYCPTNTNAADNSGTLSYVQINNSGITMDVDKEINGLSLVGVGSGTTIDNVSVLRSDDDCIELWGGTVDLSNCSTEYCTDDQFDIDDGYSGTVTDLDINQHTDGNAGMEMSGSTVATFDGLTITQDYSDKEGVLFFKKDGIGGHFTDVVLDDNVASPAYGTFYSQGDADEANISMTNVDITYPTGDNVCEDEAGGGSCTDIMTIFNACGTCSATAD